MGSFGLNIKSQIKINISLLGDVYDGKFQTDFFKDKYVLIGASAQGLFDLVKTPLGVTIPGVEVHANVIENILDQSYLVRNPNTYIFELLFSIIVALITFILSQKVKPKLSLSIFFGNILAIIIIGFSIYKFRSELVDMSYPIFIVTVTFLTGLYFRFIEENKIALDNLQKEAKLLKERELAAGVQKSLFPDISKFENFIFAKNVPARDVSGDYFDVVRSTPEEYFFTLADVSGKGVKAGMYMAKASSIFRTLTNLKFPLEKVVFGVNNELVEAKFKGMFVTAVFGKLNIKTGELVFINAGHESILTFDQNKNYEYIKSEMPPIGIVKYFTESMVKSNTMNLKDKTFVVYTDGVTEGYLKNGEELGAEGVQKIIDGMSEVTPKTIVESIEKELNWGAEKLRDDITCMAININNTELIKKNKIKIMKKFVVKIFVILFLLSSNLFAEVKPTLLRTVSLTNIVKSPSDVRFNPAGTRIFFSDFRSGENVLIQFDVDTPFNISTIDFNSKVELATNGGGIDNITDPQGFEFNSDGTKVFAINQMEVDLTPICFQLPMIFQMPPWLLMMVLILVQI